MFEKQDISVVASTVLFFTFVFGYVALVAYDYITSVY